MAQRTLAHTDCTNATVRCHTHSMQYCIHVHRTYGHHSLLTLTWERRGGKLNQLFPTDSHYSRGKKRREHSLSPGIWSETYGDVSDHRRGAGLTPADGRRGPPPTRSTVRAETTRTPSGIWEKFQPRSGDTKAAGTTAEQRWTGLELSPGHVPVTLPMSR